MLSALIVAGGLHVISEYGTSVWEEFVDLVDVPETVEDGEVVGKPIEDTFVVSDYYIKECDNILIASPIYFSELTGKLLDVGSRLQTYFCGRFFRKEEPISKPKKGAVILVWRRKRMNFRLAIMLQGIMVPSICDFL